MVESMKLLTFILNKVSDCVIILEDGKIAFINDNFESLSQYTREEIKYPNDNEKGRVPFLSDTDNKLLNDTVNDLLESEVGTEKVINLSLIQKTRNSAVPFSLHLYKYDESRIIAIVDSYSSFTRSEGVDANKLRTTEIEKKVGCTETEMVDYFKVFFDLSPICMGVIQDVGDDYEYVMCNPATATFCNSTIAEMKGKRAKSVGFTPENIEAWKQHFPKEKGVSKVHQFKVTLPHNHEEACYFTTYMYRDELDRLLFLSQDVTSFKVMEQNLEATVRKRTAELENAINVKSRFLATMSHEIRTPLSGIISSLQLLEESNLKKDQLSVLRIAKICSDQLLVLINDILDFSRLEASKVELEKNVFVTRSVFEDSIEMILLEAEKKGIEIISDIDNDVPDLVIGDCSRIKQILINLLGNAVKFSSSGEVCLRVMSREILTDNENNDFDLELKIGVSDDGIGISEASKPYIFQPFMQADSSMTRKFGGSGLGLSISKRLCELMGGSIWFTSQEGKGSEFVFTVKVKKVPSPPLSPKEARTLCELSTKRVLVVHPSKKRRLATVKKLTRLSISTVDVASIEEARSYINDQSKFDLALIDTRIKMEDIKWIASKVIQIGYTALNPELPFWKLPLKETTLVSQLKSCFDPPRNSPTLQKVKQNNKQKYNYKILVAEDNAMNQKVLKKFLTSAGYHDISIAENGKEAVEQVKKQKFDVILMDCMMPEMSGIQATEIIRKELPRDKQPRWIIALTANVFTENKERCFRAGMDEVLTKPISLSQLKETLNKYLSTPY